MDSKNNFPRSNKKVFYALREPKISFSIPRGAIKKVRKFDRASTTSLWRIRKNQETKTVERSAEMSVVSVKSPKGDRKPLKKSTVCVCVGLPLFSYINDSINPPSPHTHTHTHTYIYTHTQTHTFSEFALPFHSQKSATHIPPCRH